MSRPGRASGYAVGMQVRVLFFGVLTEAFGRREMPLELAEGATVAELVSVLREDSSNQTGEELWSRIAVSVNREYARREDVLRDGDEVALLPPVSGGSCVAVDGRAR